MFMKTSWQVFSNANWNFMCPKSGFQEKGTLQSVKNFVVRKLPELKRNLSNSISVLNTQHWCILCVAKYRFFTLYLDIFQVPENLQWLKKQTQKNPPHTNKQKPNTNPRKQYISLIILQAVIFLYLDEKLVVKGDFREENITMKLLY